MTRLSVGVTASGATGYRIKRAGRSPITADGLATLFLTVKFEDAAPSSLDGRL